MEQKTTLFLMENALGHINGTFSFAKRMQSEGFRIIYLVPLSFQKSIADQGFEVTNFSPPATILDTIENRNQKNEIEKFLDRLADRISNRKMIDNLVKAEKLNRLIRKIKPSLLFLDSFTTQNYFLLENKKIPVVLLQTMLATKKRQGIPTLNSWLLPEDDKFEFTLQRVNYSWSKYSFLRKWRKLISFGDNELDVICRMFKDRKKQILDQVDINAVFAPRIKGLNEFVLAPKSIDFDDISPTEQLYLASSMNVNRKDLVKDPNLKTVMAKLEQTHKSRVWVYCSLGTLNLTHNKKSLAFFKKVLEVFKTKKDWSVIMSTGELKPEQVGLPAPNIHLFQSVPQLEVLKYCDVMITHGGLNSILECINHTTPMLVYPLNNKWDQNGNSARIVHYKLGLRGRISKDSSEDILQKLEVLVSSNMFVEKLKEIRKRILQEDGLEKAIKLIKTMVTTDKTNSDSTNIELNMSKKKGKSLLVQS